MRGVYEIEHVPEPLTRAEVAAALVELRDLLTVKTWACGGQGSYGYSVIERGSHHVPDTIDDEGCYCIVGAVGRVLEKDPDSVEVVSVVKWLDEALRAWLGDSPDWMIDDLYVTSFSDDVTTTLKDVHELIDRALKLVRA